MKYLLCILVSLTLTNMSLPARAIEGQRWLIEASPDALLLGNISLRNEVPLTKSWYLQSQLQHAKSSTSTEQTTSNIFSFGPQFYPQLFTSHGPFFGIGMQVAQLQIDFSRQRASRTYFKPEDGEYDRWSTKVISLAMEQTVGYRITLAKTLTASCGISAAELLHSESHIKKISLMPDSVPDSYSPKTLSTKFFLNLGIVLQ